MAIIKVGWCGLLITKSVRSDNHVQAAVEPKKHANICKSLDDRWDPSKSSQPPVHNMSQVNLMYMVVFWNRGIRVSPNHPFQWFHCKPSILGYPHLLKVPYNVHDWYQEQTPSLRVRGWFGSKRTVTKADLPIGPIPPLNTWICDPETPHNETDMFPFVVDVPLEN